MKVNCSAHARIILVLTVLTTSFSCGHVVHVGDTQTRATSSTIEKLRFPSPWLGPTERSGIEQIEVRKVPNSPGGEFFFAALPYGDNHYANEVNKNLPKTQYGQNIFAVDFSAGLRARVITQDEWESGSRIVTKSRFMFANSGDEASGQIEYKQKRYSKTGKYWGYGILSPSGKWLAIFSYTGEKRSSGLFGFLGSGGPRIGDVFWQIHDTVSGEKMFEWEAKNVKNPLSFNDPAIWLEERYFLFPVDEEAQNFNVVTLPSFTPVDNPVTVHLPSRRDAVGQPLPAGARDEVWIPLVPLTKQQAIKLTARSDPEIAGARWSSQSVPRELLLAINEETENRKASRQKGDGAGDYHYRVISTYYYALTLDNATHARVATKEEWERGQTAGSQRPTDVAAPTGDAIAGNVPPNRLFPKTGVSWGSAPALNAGEWIAIFSYTENGQRSAGAAGTMFIDVYDQRLGHKLLSTTLPFTTSPNELFKAAIWIEGGYLLLPLNASLDSFALWQLP